MKIKNKKACYKLVVYKTVIYVIIFWKIHGKKTTLNWKLREGKRYIFIVYLYKLSKFGIYKIV